VTPSFCALRARTREVLIPVVRDPNAVERAKPRRLLETRWVIQKPCLLSPYPASLPVRSFHPLAIEYAPRTCALSMILMADHVLVECSTKTEGLSRRNTTKPRGFFLRRKGMPLRVNVLGRIRPRDAKQGLSGVTNAGWAAGALTAVPYQQH